MEHYEACRFIGSSSNPKFIKPILGFFILTPNVFMNSISPNPETKMYPLEIIKTLASKPPKVDKLPSSKFS